MQTILKSFTVRWWRQAYFLYNSKEPKSVQLMLQKGLKKIEGRFIGKNVSWFGQVGNATTVVPLNRFKISFYHLLFVALSPGPRFYSETDQAAELKVA